MVYQNDPNKPNLILEQIASESNDLKPNDQMNILEAALLDITVAAKPLLLLTSDYMVPAQSFSNIKQGVDKFFINFFDCLKLA